MDTKRLVIAITLAMAVVVGWYLLRRLRRADVRPRRRSAGDARPRPTPPRRPPPPSTQPTATGRRPTTAADAVDAALQVDRRRRRGAAGGRPRLGRARTTRSSRCSSRSTPPARASSRSSSTTSCKSVDDPRSSRTSSSTPTDGVSDAVRHPLATRIDHGRRADASTSSNVNWTLERQDQHVGDVQRHARHAAASRC